MADPLRIVLHTEDADPLVAALCAAFPQVACRTCDTYAGLPALLAEFRPDAVYSVRFAGSAGFPRAALFAPDGPRWIANGGAGTDHYGTWDPARTTVTNAAGVAADMMAEYVLGGFLHFSLDVPGLQADQAARRWDAQRRVVPLAGKTLLIVGLGHTGRALAQRAKAFGMHVIGSRARPRPTAYVDEVVPATELRAVIPRADCIAVATPLVPETQGLIGAEEIACMTPGALFADVSRGGVTDQTALCAALNSGRVAGAVLDVFETEPLPATSPLWGVPNVLMSPHCSSVYDGWERASFGIFLRNLERWIAGEPLVNVVDPTRGY